MKWTTGKGPKLLGAPAEAGGMPRVQSGISIRIPPETASETERRGAGGSGGGGTPSPPSTPQGGPDLPSILLKTLAAAPMPRSGIPGWSIKSDQPPDSLYTPPRVR